MKRTAAALIISLLLAAVFPVRALELETGMIRPFADNVLTVTSEDGGLLTIKAVNGTVPLDNPVTDMRVEGGTIEIPWTALAMTGPWKRQRSGKKSEHRCRRFCAACRRPGISIRMGSMC